MNADKMILGENAVFSMDSSRTGLNNNVLVVGSTGCGKTMSISEPLLLSTSEHSLIVTLTKRTLADKYAEMFRNNGYAAEILDFTAPMNGTAAFDPIRYAKTDKDIAAVAEAVVMANGRKRASTSADPYWDDASKMLLCAETGIAMFKAEKLGRRASFTDVLAVHSELCLNWDMRSDFVRSTPLDNVIGEMQFESPNCAAVRSWKAVRDLPRKTLSCVVGTLTPALESMFTDELRQAIADKRSISFHQLASRKTVLFVISSPVNKAVHRYVSMFYAAAFKDLFEFAESLPEGQLPIPVHIICDDFATGAPVPSFAEYISIFRAKGISVTLLIQSESQLSGMYGSADAQTIINNCDTYVYMGGMDLDTCHSISARLDLPLEDVMYMPLAQVCIMRRGRKPIITRRYSTTKDPRYQKLTRAYTK